MRNAAAIFQKQIKDTLKNKEILIQFMMFPVLTLIMENAVHIEEMPEHFFTNLFSVMYVGMAPLTSMAAVISEEKEKNTLRVLLMSNVKPAEYLSGIGSYIWLICMTGACVIGVGSGYRGSVWCRFMLIMGIGFLVSVLIGAAIGIWSKNQMMATSIAVPVMLVFSFLPMLSMFNENIEKIAKITYSRQLHMMLDQIGHVKTDGADIRMIFFNMLAAFLAFLYAYRKRGLD